MDLSWADAPSKNTKTNSDHSVQGSDAWLKWRGKGLGGSDSAALLGWSPWKTAAQLWSEKVGLWKPSFGPHQKAAMERGKRLEPEIRKWFEYQVNAVFKEDVEEHREHAFIRASYDGINREFKNEDGSFGRILEIKAPNAKDHEMARMGDIPEKYLTQLNWMGIVSGISWFDYVSYGSDGTYARVTLRSDKAMQDELLRRAIQFWRHVETKIEITDEMFPRWEHHTPVEIDLSQAVAKEAPEQQELFQAQAEVAVSEQAIEALVAEALLCKDEAESAQARYEAKKEKLKQILGKDKTRTCGEAVFGWQDRKGAVDYTVIPELIGLDLEQFRKPPTRAFYFNRKGEK